MEEKLSRINPAKLIGPRHYFYANLTYYLWEPCRKQYVVVEEPEGVENSQPVTSEFFVYPKQGQSDEQLERDRYDCHLWGVKPTGFDPSAPTDGANKAALPVRRLSKRVSGKPEPGQNERPVCAQQQARARTERELQRANYRRAISACLEARGYTVR